MKKITHKKILYVIIPILVILLFVMWIYGGNEEDIPPKLFNDIYGFELPESAVFEVVNAKGVYDYQAKIVVNQSDLDYMYEGFNKIFIKPADKSNAFYDQKKFEGMKRRLEWIDLNYYDIDVLYGQFLTGESVLGAGYNKTLTNRVFIRINDDETATLYIAVG